MKAAAFERRHRRARFAFAVLAIFALSLFPLRAWCGPGSVSAAQTVGAHPLGHGDGNADFCCAGVDDRVLINDSIAPGHSQASGGVSLVALIVPVLILSASAVQQPRPADAPPPSRSYYARSARILR